MSKFLKFRVSAGLKDIIGRDLISDDLIAVFELVKNSYDAHATEVKLFFEEDRIVIWDNGKGMDFDDIQNKWLFVAYSAKKEGEEDSELKHKEFEDYRNKITLSEYYAGAKGIGRFSCDRIGRKLLLTSKKAKRNGRIEQLRVDWGKFEKSSKTKFEQVNVEYIDPPIIDNSLPKLVHGTILEITSLRSSWSRIQLVELKHSLEKLINPFEIIDQNRNQINSGGRKFSISIIAKHEQHNDKKEKIARNVVNGPIQNFIFETLNLKTTQIFCNISKDGKKIVTELIDRGKLIYKIEESNSAYKVLKDVRFHLFYLNKAAKINFRKMMRISSAEFGSVFLYKNGFRVYPFGEQGEDSFGIDRRKQQGHSRYLGTREIVGRIEIHGNDEEFKETSSRDGGLKITPGYLALQESFLEKCLKRLERYVVDIQWTLKDQKDDISNVEGSIKAKSKIAKIISKLVDSNDVTLKDYNKDILNILEEKLNDEDNLEEVFENLESIASRTNDRSFFYQLKSAQKVYEKLKKEKDEANNKARQEEEARRLAEEAYERERKKNLFFNATGRNNNTATLGLIHHIKLTSKAFNSRIKILARDITSNKFNSKKALEILSEFRVYSEKILKLSEIATYSDLNFKYAKHKGDLVRFIVEYIDEIKPGVSNVSFFVNTNSLTYTLEFSILEFSVIIDNLISNSQKFSEKTTKVQIDIQKVNKGLRILFSDNGIGVHEEAKAYIFDAGFTTSRGSGIGLYTVRELVTQMKGSINFLGNGIILNGATFEILL